MVVDRFALKNNPITRSPCFTLVLKTGVRLLKTGAGFYCVIESIGENHFMC